MHPINVYIQGDKLICDPKLAKVKIEGDFNKIPFKLHNDHHETHEFPMTGAVVIYGNTSQFPGPSVTESATSAFIYNASSVPGIFNYTVYVREKSSGKFLRTDPTIENER